MSRQSDQQDSTGFSWWPMSREDLHELATSERTETVPNIWKQGSGSCLIYPARTHLFIGKPESCKTWISLGICAEEIRSGNAALFVDMEDQPTTAVDRLLALGLTAKDISEQFIYVQPQEPFGDGAADVLYEHLDQYASTIHFAVIDSMTEALAHMGGDPDKSTAVASFYHALPDRLAQERGIAVVTIDHVPKNSGKGATGWAIGSQHKISGLSGAAYAFEPVSPFGRGMVGEVTVNLSKDRIGYLRPLTLLGDDEIASVTLISDGKDVTIDTENIQAISIAKMAEKEERKANHLRDAIYKVIERSPGINTSKIRETVDARNADITSTLQAMIDDGLITFEPQGKAKLYSVTGVPL